MIYEVDFTEEAISDIAYLKRSEPQAYKKLQKLLIELQQHPKPLGNNRAGQWSRRITEKHRLIYQIEDEEITVLILSAYGHYNDK